VGFAAQKKFLRLREPSASEGGQKEVPQPGREKSPGVGVQKGEEKKEKVHDQGMNQKGAAPRGTAVVGSSGMPSVPTKKFPKKRVTSPFEGRRRSRRESLASRTRPPEGGEMGSAGYDAKKGGGQAGQS